MTPEKYTISALKMIEENHSPKMKKELAGTMEKQVDFMAEALRGPGPLCRRTQEDFSHPMPDKNLKNAGFTGIY